MLTQSDKAIMRAAILRALCRLRAKGKADLGEIVGQMQTAGAVPFAYTSDQVREELSFLIGMRFVEILPDGMSFKDDFRISETGWEYAVKNGLAND